MCDSCGATLLYEYSGTSLDTLRHMVGMGMGISFFPELYVMSEVRDENEVVVRRLKGDRLFREIGLVYRTNSSGWNLYLAIADLIEERIGGVIPASVGRH